MSFKHKDKTVKKLLYSKQSNPHSVLIKKKGNGYKKYRDQWVQTGELKLETSYPTQVDFELNPSCNLKCPMCTWSAEKTFGLGRSSWMPFKKYTKIIDQVKNKVKSVNLNYINEPLIRNDFVDFVKYAADSGIMEVMFNTNGLLLNDKTIIGLINSGLTKLSVSLDAHTERVYNKIRIGSDFKKVIKNINNFLRIRKKLKSKTPLLKVTFLRVAINKNELKPFLKYWEEKADLISIQNPSNPFDGKLFNDRRKWLGIKKFKEKKIKSNKISYDYDFDSMKRCAQPNQRLVIDSDGAVHPCCNFRGKEINIGNAFKESVYTIWNNKQYKLLRNIHKSGNYHKNKVCKVCIDHGSENLPDV